jgi:hypothetical protein
MSTRGSETEHDLGFALTVDCRQLHANDVLLRVLPVCLRAKAASARAWITVENLELLEDSVTRLLKAFDRVADEFGARIALADASGFRSAFLVGLSGRARCDVLEGRGL